MMHNTPPKYGVWVWKDKRLVNPEPHELFDVVKPTPDHPKHDEWLALKHPVRPAAQLEVKQ